MYTRAGGIFGILNYLFTENKKVISISEIDYLAYLKTAPINVYF